MRPLTRTIFAGKSAEHCSPRKCSLGILVTWSIIRSFSVASASWDHLRNTAPYLHYPPLTLTLDLLFFFSLFLLYLFCSSVFSRRRTGRWNTRVKIAFLRDLIWASLTFIYYIFYTFRYIYLLKKFNHKLTSLFFINHRLLFIFNC